MVQWVTERLDSQFFRVDSRVWCLVHDLQSSSTAYGCIAINDNGAGETLHNYVNWYWELYNEISGGHKKIAASTFWLGLPEDSELQDSLTRRPPEDIRQLMRCIEEYKWLEDDRLQSKGKAPIINHPQQSGFQ